MGPTTLFDKSFLQSLSLEEAVWFDAFFMPVICPIFYVETLADLAKDHANRSVEAGVRIIAEKTPELSGGPCGYHTELAVNNLLGHDVPLDGRIPRAGGRFVKGGGQTGVVYDESPQMQAFARWQDEEFSEVERLFAADWRRQLKGANLKKLADGLRSLGVDGKGCSSLEEAKAIAQELTDVSTDPFRRLEVAVRFFDVPREYLRTLVQRWEARGQPALSIFAPYSAFVLKVEAFFHVALAANLISTERPSNRTDVAYLFYLPFCKAFVSSDKLHRRTADLFLRPDQEFVWGLDLKSDLKRLNAHYSALPEAERELGVRRLAGHPPIDGDYMTTAIWQRLMPTMAFATRDSGDPARTVGPAASRSLLEKFRSLTEGESLSPSQYPRTTEELEAMVITRKIRRRKGGWYLVPRDVRGNGE